MKPLRGLARRKRPAIAWNPKAPAIEPNEIEQETS